MKTETFSPKLVAAAIVLANILWFATFYLEFSTFWIKITVSASILAALALWISPRGKIRFHMDIGSLIMGLFSAIALYFIFWAGKEISSMIFPFAEQQIGSIYGKGDLIFSRELSDDSSLQLVLNYDGNRSIFPDVLSLSKLSQMVLAIQESILIFHSPPVTFTL